MFLSLVITLAESRYACMEEHPEVPRFYVYKANIADNTTRAIVVATIEQHEHVIQVHNLLANNQAYFKRFPVAPQATNFPQSWRNKIYPIYKFKKTFSGMW